MMADEKKPMKGWVVGVLVVAAILAVIFGVSWPKLPDSAKKDQGTQQQAPADNRDREGR